jgi:hypothetical protein
VTTVLIPASDVQQLKDWASEHFPAASVLKGFKLSVNSLDVNVEAEQLGDVVVRVQVVPDNG